MKILKQGISKAEALKKLRNTRIFECVFCGCEWEADNTEYVYKFDQREADEWYECKCPNCEILCQKSRPLDKEEK